MDPQGNAMAVWDHRTPANEYMVGANRYSIDSGWGTGAILDVTSTYYHFPRIAMDAQGNAMAVWREDINIKASRYTVGVGWGTAIVIDSDDSGLAKYPQVAMNAAGDAMAVWQQSDGTRDNIWANRYTAGIGWGSAAMIETGSGAASDAQVAMSGDTAIAVWSQHDGTRISIFSNSYRVGEGWRGSELLETDSVRNADKPRVAMDSSGNATVVWQMYTFPGEPVYKVFMSRFSVVGGWGSATEIPTASTGDHDPQVAMDVRGNGLIIWWDVEGVLGKLWSKRYTAGAGWGPAALVELFSNENNRNHQVAMDAQGNALVTWGSSDGSLAHLWGKRYNAASGWGTAFQADTSVYGLGDYQLAMNVQGNAVAVYTASVAGVVQATYLPATSWQAAALIENDNHGDAGAPQVAMDTQGNATAVWEQSDGERYSIWAARYSPATGWGTPEVIEPDPTQNARAPRVAMDAQGNAIAVWPHFDGIRYNIWANRYTAGGGWGEPVLLETDDGDARVPRIAMDAAGNAVVVWFQNDGARNNIWANRYTVDLGWGTPTLIENNNDGAASAPQVAMDAIGNAMAVWDQDDGKRNNIWSSRYIAGVGWGTAVLIETNDAGTARYPQVKIDAKGSAVAVWQQSDGTLNNIWANRYVVGVGWGAAVILETDKSGDALLPQIAVDAQGNAIAIWSQSDGTRENIWSNRYSTGIGWGTAALLETNNAGSAGDAQVAIDPQGNALAVWGQSDGTRNNIYGNWYTPGAGWGIAVLLETDNAGDSRYPQVAMIAQGIATAVWLQSDGTRNNIWANRRQK
ncbi:MAG: hypothetical protein IPQ16_14045 [Geobacteraceae bacterium]|nr:hypothetical protein [Geobacteraceae bacterium]